MKILKLLRRRLKDLLDQQVLLQQLPVIFAFFVSLTPIARLSAYSKRRAEDEESQLTKKNLADLGELLQSHSDALINKANEVIASPRDPAIKKAFADEVRASREVTQQIVNPLRTDASEGGQSSIWDDEEILEASDNLIGNDLAFVDLIFSSYNSKNS